MSDERGMSVPIQYVMLVLIVALLSAGLFASTGGLVADERAQAVRDGLDVAGARLVTDLAASDRLARDFDGSGSAELEVVADLPERVAGSPYSLTVASGPDDRTTVRLDCRDPAVSVSVDVVTVLPVEASTVRGGRVVVAYNPATDSLEVRDA